MIVLIWRIFIALVHLLFGWKWVKHVVLIFNVLKLFIGDLIHVRSMVFNLICVQVLGIQFINLIIFESDLLEVLIIVLSISKFCLLTRQHLALWPHLLVVTAEPVAGPKLLFLDVLYLHEVIELIIIFISFNLPPIQIFGLISSDLLVENALKLLTHLAHELISLLVQSFLLSIHVLIVVLLI